MRVVEGEDEDEGRVKGRVRVRVGESEGKGEGRVRVRSCHHYTHRSPQTLIDRLDIGNTNK